MEDGNPVQIVSESARRSFSYERRADLESHLGRAAHGFGLKVQEALEKWNATQLERAPKEVLSVAKAFRTAIEGLRGRHTEKDCATRSRTACTWRARFLTVRRETEIGESLPTSAFLRIGQQILFDGRPESPSSTT